MTARTELDMLTELEMIVKDILSRTLAELEFRIDSEEGRLLGELLSERNFDEIDQSLQRQLRWLNNVALSKPYYDIEEAGGPKRSMNELEFLVHKLYAYNAGYGYWQAFVLAYGGLDGLTERMRRLDELLK